LIENLFDLEEWGMQFDHFFFLFSEVHVGLMLLCPPACPPEDLLAASLPARQPSLD